MRLLKVIHPNRGLFWFIALAIMMIIFVWYTTQKYLIELDAENNIAPQPQNAVPGTASDVPGTANGE